MSRDNAIINPSAGSLSGKIGPYALMVGTETDLNYLASITAMGRESSKRLFISRLFHATKKLKPGTAVVGPMIGAPYAVMLLETLIAGGAENILFFGWCGAISANIHIGDIILPTDSYVDEGTSAHYFKACKKAAPSPSLQKALETWLSQEGITYQKGSVWSTDAIYRETREKAGFFQKKGVLAVEMETSAIFNVGQYRNIQVAAILAVSDELSESEWRPGFRSPPFLESRKMVCQTLIKFLEKNP
jgi:uridine phosphorylase